MKGENYGWPYATYGTDYGRFIWPPAEEASKVGNVKEPIFSWVPSIGVSNLLRVGQGQFPRWKDDLLVSSLKGRSLFRLKLVEGRVVYAEPIRIGRRIRDLIEGPGGRIWLWGDEGDLISLSIGESQERGAELFGQCAECHSTGTLSGGMGPTLKRVVGRPIAAREDFNYSPAFRALTGQWTGDRLDEFLRAPDAFAPGTSMSFQGIPSAEDRAAILAYLRELR